MAVTNTLAQYGTAGDKAQQASRAKSATQSLLNLQRQQQDVDDEDERLASAPMMAGPLGGPKSQFLGPTSYFQNQAQKGQIANLTSQLAGKGPANAVQIGGGGMGPATRSLSRMGGDDGDPLERERAQLQNDLLWQNVQAGREGLVDQHRRQAGEATAALSTPDNDLFTGRTAARAQAGGDIDRDQFAQNALLKRTQGIEDDRAKGEGEAASYGAFGQDQKRREQVTDYAARSRYAPSVISSGDRLTGTLATADARQGAGAMGALARAGSAPTFTAQDQQARDSAMNAIMPNVPGQQPGGPGPQGPMKQFPVGRLEEFARAKGFSNARQAEEWLQLQGYQVQ